MKRPSGTQLTILILSILVLITCFGAFYFFIFRPFNAALHNKARADDAERASQLCDYVSLKIKTSGISSSQTNQPTMFSNPSRNSAHLEIYRITNVELQEQIFTAVKEWQATNQALSKVCVQFFESDKPRGEYGQPINMLREEFIVLTNVQSGVIFNQVAPKN